MSAAPPPPQVAAPNNPQAQGGDQEWLLQAVLKPALGLRGKDLAKRAQANLPSILRGSKLVPGLRQPYPNADLLLVPTHPSQVLRRTVYGEVKLGTRSLEQLRAELLATGLFERVELFPRPSGAVLQFSALDQLSNPASMQDPARKQWSLPVVKAEQAWSLTTGRSQIGALDGGVQTSHPDLAPNLLLQASAYAVPNGPRTDIDDWAPNLLGTQLNVPGEPGADLLINHGLNVNSLMAARWQSRQLSSPAADSGVIGICPSCKFATVRMPFPGGVLGETFAWFSRNSGVTTINLSLGADQGSLSTTLLQNAMARDVVIVASAGNHNVDAANPVAVQYPASFTGVIAVGASDLQDKRWDERRIAALPLQLRHAGTGADYVINQRCTILKPSYDSFIEWARECGSTNDPRVDLFAPGAQMIGAADRLFADPGRLKKTRELLPTASTDKNKNQIAAMGLGIGNSGVARTTSSNPTSPLTQIHPSDVNGENWDPVADTGYAKLGQVPIIEAGSPGLNYGQWGPMTGTSMAAPMVTGTVGLMRSINPLVSATSVRSLLTSSAMDTITEHQPGVELKLQTTQC